MSFTIVTTCILVNEISIHVLFYVIAHSEGLGNQANTSNTFVHLQEAFMRRFRGGGGSRRICPLIQEKSNIFKSQLKITENILS